MPIVVDSTGDPGSTITLTRLWLNNAADPADLMSFRTPSYTPGATKPGDVRELAGGRLRLVTRAGRARSHSVVLRKLSAEQEAWLDDHLGELLTVRDPAGGKYVATYLGLSVPHTVDGEDTVTLALSQVTRSEAV